MVQIRIDEEDYDIVRQRAMEEGRTIKGTLHIMIEQAAHGFQPMAKSTSVNVPNLMDNNQLQQYIAEQQAKIADKHKAAPKPAPQREMSEAELKKIIAARSVS